MLELNPAFLKRMKEILGDEFDDFKSSLTLAEQKGVFVNQNKINIDDFKNIVDFEIEPIPYERAGFYIKGEKLGKHPLHHAGAFYIQDPSAMFTVNAFNFKGDERVLDMCAAPGGKSIQIANRIPNGVLVSNEVDSKRSQILYSNIERMGLRNVIITSSSAQELSRAYADCFDVCLVDAPCSGEGMFRRGEDYIKEWNENLPDMCSKRQLEILMQADKTIKQGGAIIYSTCTYSYEENEGVVNAFLSEHDYTLLYISAQFSRGIGMEECVRIYPHKVRGEGQFVAVMKKNDFNEFPSKKNLKLKKSSISNEFLKENLENFEFTENIYEYNKDIYYIKDVDLIRKDVRYVSLGVKLGSLINNRFEPHHFLFSSFGKQFKKKIDLDFREKMVHDYLRGESFEVDLLDGYGAFLVNSCPVGGFKIVNHKLKNHYPKGLRMSK